MSSIRVSEHFYSIQGEGPTVGVPAVFLRLQGCNLDCGRKGGSWTCDTEEVWKSGSKYNIVDFFQVFYGKYVKAFKSGAHLVITGGEPLLQQQAIISLLQLFEFKPTVEIETNGTIMPITSLGQYINQWNVSPKLSNSGEPCTKRINQKSLTWFLNQPNVIFKFVVSSEYDINEIEKHFPNIKRLPIRQKFIMPAADNRFDLHQSYESIIDLAKRKGFSLSQRFHITLWDQTTGV